MFDLGTGELQCTNCPPKRVNCWTGMLLRSISFDSFSNKFVNSHQIWLNQTFSLMIFWARIIPVLTKANLKNIFVSPYPTLFYWYGLVGRKFFFFNFSNWIPIKLNLIVYIKTCLKRPLKKTKKSFFLQDWLSHNAGQKYCRMLPGSILQYFRPSFNLQVLLYSPTKGNKIKYTNNLLRIFFKDNTVCIRQFSKFAMKLKKKILDWKLK